MKKLEVSKMESIEGGDCFSSLLGAVDSFWDCFESSSNKDCATGALYLFDLINNCVNI
jgi:hypothetical protein